MNLTRRQQQIYDYLKQNEQAFRQPPTLDELCQALTLASRGSLHKHIQALIEAGLVQPMMGKQRGIRLTQQLDELDFDGIPFLGRIAAGQPIEAIAQPDMMRVPDQLMTAGDCYVLEVCGDSMIDDGIYDGDYAVIERADYANNGDTVVALIDGEEATLKRLEQLPGEVRLHPANSKLSVMRYQPQQVTIQGVLVGLMRRYS